MKFTVQDTLSVYRKIIAEQNAEKKASIFKDELMAPYEGMFNVFGCSLHPAAGKQDAMQFLQGLCYVQPWQLEEVHLRRLGQMEKFGAWRLMGETLEKACTAFKGHEGRIPLKHIQAGIFLLDPGMMDPVDHSYTGFGGIPGYVMMTYGEPDAYNLSKFQSALAHEVHHTIKFSVHPFNPMTITLGEYMVAEGLAEAFGTWLFGEDKVGYYIEEFDYGQMPRVRAALKSALGLKSFAAVQAYLFGDRKAARFGGKGVGMPDFAGYAAGYHAVRAYLEKTGKTPVEATFVPAAEILEVSGYFE